MSYKRKRLPDHPNSFSCGSIEVHRLVMSEHLGRPLKSDEIVHHIDGDKSNNDISNLEILSAKEHAIEHYGEKSGKMIQASKTPEAIDKRKNTFKKIKHAQGKRNSQFGTMWITNGTDNKKLKRDQQIPSGYYKGRC